MRWGHAPTYHDAPLASGECVPFALLPRPGEVSGTHLPPVRAVVQVGGINYALIGSTPDEVRQRTHALNADIVALDSDIITKPNTTTPEKMADFLGRWKPWVESWNQYKNELSLTSDASLMMSSQAWDDRTYRYQTDFESWWDEAAQYGIRPSRSKPPAPTKPTPSGILTWPEKIADAAKYGLAIATIALLIYAVRR